MTLLINIFTIFFLPIACGVDPVVIQLRPEEILNTFQSVISSDYLRTLANEFAIKAAEHVISEMKNQKKLSTVDYIRYTLF